MGCTICGAVEELVGKRYVIVHDYSRHPQGEIPERQLDVQPIARTREQKDFSRETYDARVKAGRESLKRLGSGD
jgi:hypothetical protein